MLLDKADSYGIDVDLDQLRLVELESCPEIYNDNDHHYIYFDAPTSDPIWRSEPHAGRAISPKEFVGILAEKFGSAEAADSRNALRDILTDVGPLGISEEARAFRGRRRRDIVRLTEEALTIVRMNRG
jgi:hypothetical protein